MTKENAKQIATDALSNSGGNPNLQRLGRTVDKGAYFEIISHNRLNEGSGMYKVYKNGEVEYKMVHIVTLINFKIHVFMQNQGIAKAAKTPSSSNDKQVNSVDCARELNRYYVGTVASSEVPSSKSLKILKHHNLLLKHSQVLDDTQQHSTQLLASLLVSYGTSLLLKRKHHSHSY